jgi:hypothetical protein
VSASSGNFKNPYLRMLAVMLLAILVFAISGVISSNIEDGREEKAVARYLAEQHGLDVAAVGGEYARVRNTCGAVWQYELRRDEGPMLLINDRSPSLVEPAQREAASDMDGFVSDAECPPPHKEK